MADELDEVRGSEEANYQLSLRLLGDSVSFVPPDERIEGAVWTVMTELDVWNVVRDRILARRHVLDLFRRDKQEFRHGVDKA